MNVGENIKYLRELKGLTQSDLGQLLNVSDKTISSWEVGRTEPNIGKVALMSEIFGCLTSDITQGNFADQKKISGVRIPVLGKVQAGLPIEAIENIIDYEEISEEMAKNGTYFGLQIKGDSMEPRFVEGDVVIVRKQSYIENGQIGVVLINGKDATIKVIHQSTNGITLDPLNPSYEMMFFNIGAIKELPVEIIGRVVELRGKF